MIINNDSIGILNIPSEELINNDFEEPFNVLYAYKETEDHLLKSMLQSIIERHLEVKEIP